MKSERRKKEMGNDHVTKCRKSVDWVIGQTERTKRATRVVAVCFIVFVNVNDFENESDIE